MRVTPIQPIQPFKNPPKYKAQPMLRDRGFSVRHTETGKIEACESEDHMWKRFDEINGFETAPKGPSR